MANRNIIWTGRPSQLMNFWVYLFLFWTILFPLIAFLKVRTRVFELTEDRLFDKVGILFQRTNQMELIRIRDYEVTRSLLQRIMGKGTITLITRDETTPRMELPWILDPEDVAEKIRDASEKAKSNKNYREAEVY